MKSQHILAVAILMLLNAVMFIRVFNQTHAKGTPFHEVWENVLVEDHPESRIGRLAIRVIYVFVSIVALITRLGHFIHE